MVAYYTTAHPNDFAYQRLHRSNLASHLITNEMMGRSAARVAANAWLRRRNREGLPQYEVSKNITYEYIGAEIAKVINQRALRHVTYARSMHYAKIETMKLLRREYPGRASY